MKLRHENKIFYSFWAVFLWMGFASGFCAGAHAGICATLTLPSQPSVWFTYPVNGRTHFYIPFIRIELQNLAVATQTSWVETSDANGNMTYSYYGQSGQLASVSSAFKDVAPIMAQPDRVYSVIRANARILKRGLDRIGVDRIPLGITVTVSRQLQKGNSQRRAIQHMAVEKGLTLHEKESERGQYSIEVYGPEIERNLFCSALLDLYGQP